MYHDIRRMYKFIISIEIQTHCIVYPIKFVLFYSIILIEKVVLASLRIRIILKKKKNNTNVMQT